MEGWWLAKGGGGWWMGKGSYLKVTHNSFWSSLLSTVTHVHCSVTCPGPADDISWENNIITKPWILPTQTIATCLYLAYTLLLINVNTNEASIEKVDLCKSTAVHQKIRENPNFLKLSMCSLKLNIISHLFWKKGFKNPFFKLSKYEIL